MHLLKKMINKEKISSEDLISFINGVIEGKISHVQAGSVLTALAMRDVDEEVLFGVVQALYNLCAVDYGPCDAIDTCGTGGSGRLKYNISSAVAITLWAMGNRVAKHGNRSASGRIGSADVFFLSGWPQDISPNDCIRVFEETGFSFLFAPLFFPPMKAFAPIRKELGIRTVFNLAGPLANPFKVKNQIIGISSPKLLDVFVAVLKRLGRSALVFASEDGLDEFHPFSRIQMRIVKKGQEDSFTLDPGDVVDRDLLDELKEEDIFPSSVDVAKNEFLAFLQGEECLGFRVLTAMNAGLALFLLEKVSSVKDGFLMVFEFLNSGGVKEKWQELKKNLAFF